MGVFFIICCFIYILLYWIYLQDCDCVCVLVFVDVQFGIFYDFEKFSLEEENEFEIIDVYGEYVDDFDFELDDFNNSKKFIEIQWMLDQKYKLDEFVQVI